MHDIPVGAEMDRKEFTRVLRISNAQLHCLACECHPRALPQQLDNVGLDASEQLQ